MPKSVLLIIIITPLIGVVVLTAVIRHEIHTKQKMLLTAAIGGINDAPAPPSAGVPTLQTFNAFAKRFVDEFQKWRVVNQGAESDQTLACSLGHTDVAEVEGSIYPVQAGAEISENWYRKSSASTRDIARHGTMTFHFAYLHGKWVAMGGSEKDDSGKLELISEQDQQKMIDAMGK